MKLNLVESKGDRNIVMSKASEGSVNLVEMLKKYGEVVDYMTSDMVAQIFNVGERAIQDIATTKGDELKEYGYRVYKRSELLNMGLPYLENIPNRGLRLYPTKAVIVVGMMLTESEVAEHLRKDIIDILFNDNRKIELARKAELLLDIYNGGQEGILASRELVELEKQPLIEKIEKDKPKVTFANRVLKSNDNVLVRQVAKMASDEGFVIGERKLYKKLREWGYICNGSTEPTQVGMNRNYFTLKINVVQTPYGIKSSRTTLVTPRGQIHIVERLMKEMENLKLQGETLEK